MIHMTQPMDVHYELNAPDQYDPVPGPVWPTLDPDECSKQEITFPGPPHPEMGLFRKLIDPAILDAIRQFPELTR